MNPPPSLLQIAAVLLALLFIALILYSIAASPSGPFPSYPHSGFCPDSPSWHPSPKTLNP